MRVSAKDARQIAVLLQELAEFPASETDRALRHALESLVRLTGANNAYWLGATRKPTVDPGDIMRGWQSGPTVYLDPSPANMAAKMAIDARLRANLVDPLTRKNLTYAGRPRAMARADSATDADWERSWVYNEFLKPRDIEDRIVASSPLGLRVEGHFGLDRGRRDKRFGERERDLLQLFSMGAFHFHREVMLARGYVYAKVELTPRERAVASLLLTDMREKEIAKQLGLTARTTHQYVVAICRKFGVAGRIGLMALWLRHRGDAPPAI